MAVAGRSDVSADTLLGTSSSSSESLDSLMSSLQHRDKTLLGSTVGEVLGLMKGEDGGRQAEKTLVRVPFVMSSSDEEAVRAYFPTYRFETTRMPAPDAGRMELFRLAALRCLSQGDGFAFDEVTALGMSLVTPAVSGQSWVHTCLDTSDVVKHAVAAEEYRIVQRIAAASAHRDSAATNFAKVIAATDFAAESTLYCTDAASCRHQSSTVWIDHTQIDIPVMQVAATMEQHGSDRCFGLMVFDEQMLDTDRGDIPRWNAEFMIDRERDLLTVVSKVDLRTVWRMRHSVWRQFVDEAIVKVDGDCYMWERFAVVGGFLIYRMVRTRDIPMTTTNLSWRYWRARDDLVRLTNYRLKSRSLNPFLRSSWLAETVRWPRGLYEAVARRASQIEAGRYEVSDLFRVLRDHCHTYVVDGGDLREPRYHLTDREKTVGVGAIYSLHYRTRFEASETVREVSRALVSHGAAVDGEFLPLISAVVGELCSEGLQSVRDFFRFRPDAFDPTPTVEPLGAYVQYTRMVPREGPTELRIRDWVSKFDMWWPCGKYSRHVALSNTGLRGRVMGKLRELRASALGGEAPTVVERDHPDVAVGGGVAPTVVERNAPSVVTRLVSPPTALSAPQVVLENVEVALPGEREAEVASFRRERSCVEELRDTLVRKHGREYHDNLRTQSIQFPDDTVPHDEATHPVNVPDPTLDIQSVIDQCFPGHAQDVLDSLQDLVHTTEQKVSMVGNNNKLNVSYMDLPAPSRVLEPVAVAPAQGAAARTTLNLVQAWNKRNNDAPALTHPVDVDEQATRNWQYMADNGFFVPNYRELLATWETAEGKVRPDVEALEAWLKKVDPSKLPKLKSTSEDFRSDHPLNQHKLLMKCDMKPQLDVGAANAEMAKMQTIVCHETDVTAMFSPEFAEISDRLLKLLHPSIVVQLMKDPKEMQRRVRAAYARRRRGRKLHSVEVDMSKYDKSQGGACWALEKLVYLKLGLDPEVVDMWMDACIFADVKGFGMGFSASVLYQRRSGTATTTLGNTLLNIFIVIPALKLSINDIVFVIALGDDQAVYTYVIPDLGAASVAMTTEFNLTVKCEVNDVGYVCSQYVVPVGDTVVLMSDPLKRMIALRRRLTLQPDDDPDTALAERFQSFRDLMGTYSDARAREALNECVMRRRGVDSILRGIEALYALSLDAGLYRSQYARGATRVGT